MKKCWKRAGQAFAAIVCAGVVATYCIAFIAGNLIVAAILYASAAIPVSSYLLSKYDAKGDEEDRESQNHAENKDDTEGNDDKAETAT